MKNSFKIKTKYLPLLLVFPALLSCEKNEDPIQDLEVTTQSELSFNPILTTSFRENLEVDAGEKLQYLIGLATTETATILTQPNNFVVSELSNNGLYTYQSTDNYGASSRTFIKIVNSATNSTRYATLMIDVERKAVIEIDEPEEGDDAPEVVSLEVVGGSVLNYSIYLGDEQGATILRNSNSAVISELGKRQGEKVVYTYKSEYEFSGEDLVVINIESVDFDQNGNFIYSNKQIELHITVTESGISAPKEEPIDN